MPFVALIILAMFYQRQHIMTIKSLSSIENLLLKGLANEKLRSHIQYWRHGATSFEDILTEISQSSNSDLRDRAFDLLQLWYEDENDYEFIMEKFPQNGAGGDDSDSDEFGFKF